jgi:multiple sugar transport system ATP-binding protein
MGAVSLQSVSKSFGAVDVIRDVSIEIEAGEFCVLIGPSGSGKSTLLRMIAGLETVSSGTICFGGRDVTDVEPRDRDIAMVFQSYALYPQMSVRENMGFALRLAKRSKAEIQARTDAAAAMLGLEPLLDRLPKELSGGQRQRVAMGRAIVRDPSVFLFDEPLSNLDAKLRGQVRSEIRELHRRLGTTSVYVTHDQVEAMTMGQKIVVLRAGRIEQVGAPLDLYDRPESLFVAGFIGAPTINVIDAQVAADGQGLVLAGDAGHGRLPNRVPACAGRPLKLGIRPEHLRILPATDSSGDGIAAVVRAVEITGADTTLFCDSAAGELRVSASKRDIAREGERLRLWAAPERLLAFDPETERRLDLVS